jgi:RNA polymerase sigma-70 factor (ECF subfamily)
VAHWEEVLAEVVRDRRSALVGYACLFTLDWSDAEDVVQEALVRTFSRRRSFPNARAAEGYVRQAVLTVFLDGTRRRKAWGRREHLLVAESAGRSPEDTATVGLDVQAALANLAPRERACVVLRFCDDLLVGDIAAELRLSEGAVKRYLFDGAGKLREALGGKVTWRDEELVETGFTSTVVQEGSGS